MNIVVIGLGSMGKRRIRLIQDLHPEFNIYGIDERADRRKEAVALLNVETFESLSRIDKKIECAFVCTSPLTHATVIKECLLRGWNVFTELNLVDLGYEQNLKLAEEKGCTLFLSSTFFYREEIRFIHSMVSRGKNWNYIYHIGQYLPDWHPWESYNDFFVGDKVTNGCREIMAIELPWLTETFGAIIDAHVISDKMSKLNIGFNDNYLIQIQHKNNNKGILVVDVVSPVAVRKMEAYAEGEYLSWNGTPDSVFVFDKTDKKLKSVKLFEPAEHNEDYSAFIVENAYRNEIKDFFDVVNKKKEPPYGFEQDQIILGLIDMMGA